MKKSLLPIAILIAAAVPFVSQAQNTDREFYMRPSYWNPHDQRGINRFETTKAEDTIAFQGPRIRFGAGFTQQFQNLKHETKSGVALYKMGAGFNLAQANLYTDIQLADGIRLDVTTYLSTRHHNETWVKGGYIQFDKLPFKGKFWDDLMKLATIKIGHMEVNYGDAHFRRTDAGDAIRNPFAENYIVDAFSTEIGGEVYLQKNGLLFMVGATNGTINSSIAQQGKDITGDSAKNPAVYFKLGVDKQLGKLRGRLTGSAYFNNKSQRNVLYAGDRAGSHYFGVLEGTSFSAKDQFTSGRFNPGMSRNIQAYMVNGFAKYAGLEFFGTWERGRGNAATAADPTHRKFTQTAVEGIYRFGARENVFIGARYNTVDAQLPNYKDEVNINRTSFAAGWFLTPSVLLKGEIVNQKYKNFEASNMKGTPAADVRNGGKFNGYVIEAVVGF
jgi:hypothetical protein